MNKNLFEGLKSIVGPLFYKFYPKTFGRGYERYKINIIRKKLENKKANYNYYLDERVVEVPWVIKQLKKFKGNLLDAGSTLNQEYLLKKINHFNKIFIITLYPEKEFFNNLNVSYIYEDLSSPSLKNSSIDVITCISTLEHLNCNNDIYNYGKFKKKILKGNKIKNVLKSFKMILKKNGVLLITVPFGKKGIYHNMQQFDFSGLLKIKKNFNPRNFKCEFYRVKQNKWIKCSHKECSNIIPKTKSLGKNKLIALSANSIALIKMTK